jgi:hypothetical protein
MSDNSWTTLEHKTPESNKSVGKTRNHLIVKLLDAPLTHAKRERVHALLEQLSFRK